jgi:repressor of nif and glnA expression
MKRDQDLLWTILALLEGSSRGYEDDTSIGAALETKQPSLTFDTIRHHLNLLGDRGLATPHGHGNWRITDAGHDAHAANPAHVTQQFAKLGQ